MSYNQVHYLWECTLTDKGCGWLDIYNDALANYPKGKYVVIDGENYYIDPVKTYFTIHQLFSDICKSAKYVYDNFDKSQMRYFLSDLIYYDCCLLNIIDLWEYGVLPEDQPMYYSPSSHTQEYYFNLNGYLLGFGPNDDLYSHRILQTIGHLANHEFRRVVYSLTNSTHTPTDD